MKRRWSLVLSTAVSALALGVSAGSVTAQATPAAETTPAAQANHHRPYTFAVIGDIPYGEAEIAAFPKVVSQINADPDVRLVDHLGDIKNGSSVCSDEYFAMIRTQFDRFSDPLVYTPGDNEWTDCHRTNNGGYDPLERLNKVRQTFFPQPGYTLGERSVPVISQTRLGFPENVRYNRAGVAFAAVHIVGSNNSLEPWTGKTTPTPEQTVEVLRRTAADIQLISETFSSAKRHHRRAVVLLTQADMFDPTVKSPEYGKFFAFQPIVEAIARESRAFGGPVYLINGDSHVFNSDQPLSTTSVWRSFYGVNTPVNNLTRITVDGSDNANDYLKVTIHPRGKEVLTWDRVPFTT